MRVKHIGESSAALRTALWRCELVDQQAVSFVAITHARPKIFLPRERPARADRAALDQRRFRRRKKFRVTVRSEECAGEKPVEMRQMPVGVFRAVHVFKPFLELAIFPDLERRETLARGQNAFPEISIHAENLARFG